jgi:myo-inositol 2-dehydrogenase / D-chiro-inositol 1-dehydrogenase
MSMIALAQFGAGRIGQIHARNVAATGEARLKYLVDVNQAAAESLAGAVGAAVADRDSALADPEVRAVIIGSSTDTHAELIEAAARAGKAIFCEKPIDLDLGRTRDCLKVVEACDVPLFIGFNRRFDPSFAGLKAALDAGRIGKLENLTITSRDPSPPPADYVARSGGLFRDMMIHDFDMARWLLGAEPVRLYARGSVLVDPAIGAAGDVDSAVVVLETAEGVLCQIINSRRAAYGYDQRIEAFGAEGLLLAGNRDARSLQAWDGQGVSGEKPLYFFLERYAEAYRAEMAHFLACLSGQETPRVAAADGLRALELAEAANESLRKGQAVEL